MVANNFFVVGRWRGGRPDRSLVRHATSAIKSPSTPTNSCEPRRSATTGYASDEIRFRDLRTAKALGISVSATPLVIADGWSKNSGAFAMHEAGSGASRPRELSGLRVSNVGQSGHLSPNRDLRRTRPNSDKPAHLPLPNALAQYRIAKLHIGFRGKGSPRLRPVAARW